jgi:hypothetical protein
METRKGAVHKEALIKQGATGQQCFKVEAQKDYRSDLSNGGGWSFLVFGLVVVWSSFGSAVTPLKLRAGTHARGGTLPANDDGVCLQSSC